MIGESELIGRHDEIRSVERALDRLKNGPQTLIIEGQAGIGKTTIWLEGLRVASARGIAVLNCRCVESELGLPFAAVGDLFTDTPSELLERLHPSLRHAMDAALLRAESHDEVADVRALGIAIRQLLIDMARPAGLVVAVDDPSWMDAPSARAVGFALHRLGDAPVCLLLTRRTPMPRGGLDNADLLRGETRYLKPEPLDAAEIELLLRRRASVRLGRSYTDVIYSESGGNPYYALEMARRADARTAVVGRSGPLPDSLQALIGTRVATQPARVRRLLLLASAASRPTRTVLESIPDPTIPAALDQAIDEDLLNISEDAVSFAHPLFANAAYWGASASARRRAHSQLAMAAPEWGQAPGRGVAVGDPSDG